MRKPLSLALLLVAASAAAMPDALFDGARAGGAPLPVVVPYTFRPAPLAPYSKPLPSQPVQSDPDVGPQDARGISDGYLGLYPESGFQIGTGKCSLCNGPLQGKWYFPDDVIATPKAGEPAIVWLGSHELIEGAKLSPDGARITLADGTSLPFSLTPKIPSNRSYYDPTSLAFLSGRTLRIRGEFAVVDGVRTLVARSIWPEDFKLDAASIKTADVKNAQDVDALVAADKGGATAPFETRLLWEKPGAGRDWEGKPVMGFMLNGAQGDDDEALAGHSSFFTGRYGPGGSMADWMFDNFYDMNTVSEKGIIASLVPMDKYMTDLNSGQSWYRPSYLIVLVMKDARAPLALQDTFIKQYQKYYAQDLKYDHTHENCTALVADPVRADGWKFPEKGATPWPVAKAISTAVGLAGGKKAGDEVFATLREEPTRSFPRASFDAVGADALALAGAQPLDRTLTPLEKEIQDDLLAVLFVRLPQIPSSRAFGRDPAGSVFDYMSRTPLDHSKWKTIPSYPRPFPPPH